MTKGRHSYVAFYPSDWLGGTARMTRLVKSVYHDVCLYNWDKAAAVPPDEMMLMLADLEAQGDAIVKALIGTGKLKQNLDGSVYSERALAEALKALELWERKSAGGKRGAKVVNGGKTPDAIPAVIQPQNLPETSSFPLGKEEESGRINPPLSASADDTGGKPDAKEPEKPDPIDPADMQRIAESWNEMAAQVGLPQISKMTEKRKTAMRARLKDYGLASILEAIEQVPSRSFLLGHNDRGWRADIDFLMLPNSVAKINEGTAYKGKTGGGWTDA